MIEQEAFAFRVIDLKQHIYCPRILYYHTVLPQVRPITYKMAAGIQAHIQAEGREKRRGLRAYGLQAGRRTFDVPLYSVELGLSGVLDMLIETDEELIPVDYKQTQKAGKHFQVQLAAYGRLLEIQQVGSGKAVKRGFLYFIPRRKAVEIPFTAPLHRQLETALRQLRQIGRQQQMPQPTPYHRCVDCEFRRFCNDVL